MRILVLHGYSSNYAWCKRGDKRLQWLLKPLGITLHYANGPIPDPYSDHRFCWWRANEDGSSYSGWNETVEYLASVFEEDGPFDGVLGHSQGAACAAALVALMSSGQFKQQLRFAIFSGGFLPRDPNIAALFPVPLDHPDTGWPDRHSDVEAAQPKLLFDIPTLHVVGKLDRITPPTMNMALAARFTNPVIVHHNGRHKMLVDTETGRSYLEFLCQFAGEADLATLDSIRISSHELCSSCCSWSLLQEGTRLLNSKKWYCRTCSDAWSNYDDPDQVPSISDRRDLQECVPVLGRCAAQCGHRINWHHSHCCIRCADTCGKEHDWGRCERHSWSNETFDIRAFNICFPSASTLGERCGGISGLSVEVGNDNDDWAKKAAALFKQHGFVVLRKAITPKAAGEVLQVCRGIHAGVMKEDPYSVGNRNPGRYSFNNCTGSGHCMHIPCFVEHLVDNSYVLDVLDHIYKPSVPHQDDTEPYFIARAAGDFCCGWVESFQKLHSDLADARPLYGTPSPEPGPDGSLIFGWFGDMPMTSPSPIHDRSRPPTITVNYVVQPLTRWNGPMRIVTWDDMVSYASQEKPNPPTLFQELRDCPSWLASRVFPLEPGDALIRDARVWHGGCPNLSGETRYLPSLEVVSPEYDAWFQPLWEKQENAKGRFDLAGWAMPREIASKLIDPRVRRRCRNIVEERVDGEANRRIGDVNWLGGKIAREQWPKFFRDAELGAMEVELAGMMATLQRLSSMVPDMHEGVDVSHNEGRLVKWLQAVKDQSFPLMKLLRVDETTQDKFNSVVEMLLSALSGGTEPKSHVVIALGTELYHLLAGIMHTVLLDAAPSGEVKRRRLEGSSET